MKKKLIAVCLIIAMMAITVVGGTMAYFFDTATATNTFTVGNVNIELDESQYVPPVEEGEEGTLETYPDESKNIQPGSAENATSKIAWIKNTGSNEAWVWAEVWIPKELDNPGDAAENSLHFNYYGHFIDDYNRSGNYKQSAIDDLIVEADGVTAKIPDMVNATDPNLWSLHLDDSGEFIVREEPKDGIVYNVYTFKMEEPLAAGKISLPFLRQVYMDSRVEMCRVEEDNKDGKVCYILADETTHLAVDSEWKFDIRVNAYAMQVDGFDTVEDAMTAYFIENPPAVVETP